MDGRTNITVPDPAAQEAQERAKAEEPVELTREELERIVEEIVSKHLAEAQGEVEERVAQARAEGERLANMSEEERRQYDAEAVREREERLEQREAELNRRELRAWAVEALQARGLPRELEKLVPCTDRESCASGVEALEKAFREAVQRGVDERISRGRPLPKAASGAQAGMVQRMRSAAGLDGK